MADRVSDEQRITELEEVLRAYKRDVIEARQQIAALKAARRAEIERAVDLTLTAAAQKASDCAGLPHSTTGYIYDSVRAMDRAAIADRLAAEGDA